MDFYIKKADATHIAALLAFDQRCNDGEAFWDDFVWEMVIQNDALYFAHDLSGKILGYIYVGSNGEHLTINAFEVDSALRGRGIGKALLKHVSDIADHDKKTMWLSVSTDNNYAQKLYKSFNFVAQPVESERPVFSVEMLRAPRPK